VADSTVGFQFEACAPELASAIRVRLDDESAPCDSVGIDSVLIAELRSGKESAYEALLQRFEHPVYNMISRLMDDPADAPDVVQEVFLKIFRNIGAFRGDSSLKTWIYRISVNEARNHRRWFSRHRRREVAIDAGPGEEHGYADWLADPGRSPFETALDGETAALIQEALAAVNPKFRAALVLREIEGLSYGEVAEILEISLGTVKSRILRGREALRKQIADRLGADSALAWSPQLVE
jgi:RNA polymerase sigma-70 factor, ECF subfamily